MAHLTTLLGITTDRMDMLIMLGRNGGTDTGHVATGGIIEIRIAEAISIISVQICFANLY